MLEQDRQVLVDRLAQLDVEVVRRLQARSEPGVQQAHVVEVGLARDVAVGMAEHLDVGGQAANLATVDQAAALEAGRREDPVGAGRHPVDAVAGLVEPDRVNVDLAAARVAQDEVDVAPTRYLRERVAGQGFADLRRSSSRTIRSRSRCGRVCSARRASTAQPPSTQASIPASSSRSSTSTTSLASTRRVYGSRSNGREP